jgi:dTDP-4-amino-4,6-dideoxygalactose transaminase
VHDQATIPFSPPDITKQDIESVVDVLNSGWITTGQKTKLFEDRIANYCNVQKTVCLNSATSCMELILRLFSVGVGDEVITSAYTYTASASVIAHVGATIVLCDTSGSDYEMDYNQLESLITERTKVIIPVDIAGKMADYARIFSIVESLKFKFRANGKYQEELGRILILADAAHSFGASRDGIISGSYADFTSFSFHAVKNLTTAEGGALVWKELSGIDSNVIYNEFMLMSLHGQSKDALSKTKTGMWEYDVINVYYKCNMTDIAAALGLSQLSRYANMLKRRREIARMYNNAFQNSPIEYLDHFSSNSKSSAHLYLTRVSCADEDKRNKIIQELSALNISCNVHYKPLPLLTAYKKLGFKISDFPNAYNQYANEISIPLHTLLTDSQVERIIIQYLKLVRLYI